MERTSYTRYDILEKDMLLLKLQIEQKDKTIEERDKEINRLRRVCVKNAKKIIELERMVMKVRRWYQILIWEK
jgi:predicted RNase H-like nuclease (RuvC/YqgF family)